MRQSCKPKSGNILLCPLAHFCFAVDIEDPDSGIPADAIATLKVLVMALAQLEAEIGKLNAEIARRAKENDVAR
jgi:sialic acid synthase SpsE